MPPRADQTLLKALAVWGPGQGGESGFWARFEPAWPRRLAHARASQPPASRQEALKALTALHGWQARPDARHVHPSWWVRAVQDESPAVRATVAREASEEVKTSLAGHEPFPAPGFPPLPEAVAWALSLWQERLVGDEPVSAEDRAEVKELVTFSETELTGRLMLLGLAKQAYAAGDSAAIPERLLSRYRRAAAAWGESREESPLRQARRDAQAVAHLSALQAMARLGIATLARLLQDLEPYRFRWVLQHLPYSVARQVRGAATGSGSLAIDREIRRFEEQVWKVAIGLEGAPGGGESREY